MINIRYTISILATTISVANAVNFNGNFVATKECPMYVSKNQGTNPGGIKSIIGTTYPIAEANALPASWYRVKDQVNGLRWVEATCGQVNGESGVINPVPSNVCLLESGKSDSYVLALSLQSAFCETTGFDKGKKECTTLTPNSPYIRQFSLHGLWPNQDACGTRYGFCNAAPQQASHCDYAPILLSLETDALLKKYMASYQYGSCLERHEWYKHGSCQDKNVDDYYFLATKLTEQVNNSSLGSYLSQNTGKVITVTDFNYEFDASFGKRSSKKIKLICKNNLLIDIYVELPNLDKINESSLVKLLPLAKDAQKTNCQTQFKLSDFSVN